MTLKLSTPLLASCELNRKGLLCLTQAHGAAITPTMSDSQISKIESLLEILVDQGDAIVNGQNAIQQSQEQIIKELTAEPEDSQQLGDALRRIALDIAEIKRFMTIYVTRT